jgi:pyruvate,orthophosphate dikinase
MIQLKFAIEAVFRSWMGKRAVDYRKEFNITSEMANGTAVNVCTMVFGNMGFDSATGVAFTRDPGTGENVLYGEYLVNAQGEDVVAGIRTPKPIQEMKREMPKIYRELERVRKVLEEHFHEVQDFEFTVEKGTLYILQTRNGKMNAQAIVRTSKEMVAEKLIDKEKAILRLKPQELEQLLHNRIDPNFKGKPIAVGLPASPGAASGKAIFDADEAERVEKLGHKVILVREETKPEDIHGFFAAQGRAGEERPPMQQWWQEAWVNPAFVDAKNCTSTQKGKRQLSETFTSRKEILSLSTDPEERSTLGRFPP